MKGYTNATVKPITVTTLSVSENGDYTAPSGSAYGSVTVEVPSSGGLMYEVLVPDAPIYFEVEVV